MITRGENPHRIGSGMTTGNRHSKWQMIFALRDNHWPFIKYNKYSSAENNELIYYLKTSFFFGNYKEYTYVQIYFGCSKLYVKRKSRDNAMYKILLIKYIFKCFNCWKIFIMLQLGLLYILSYWFVGSIVSTRIRLRTCTMSLVNSYWVKPRLIISKWGNQFKRAMSNCASSGNWGLKVSASLNWFPHLEISLWFNKTQKLQF